MNLPNDKSIRLPCGTEVHVHGQDVALREEAGKAVFFVRSGGRLPIAWVSWVSRLGANCIETIPETGWHSVVPGIGLMKRTEIGEREKYHHPEGV